MTEAAALANFTEDSAKAALIEAKGDMFVAAQSLGVTALRLDRAIRLSALLQTTVAAIESERSAPDFDKATAERIEEAVQRRIALYRVDGLDALHDLATMPIDENSAMAQVKLAAAARLAGSTDSGAGGSEFADTLRALNQQYHEHAPRIRVVRERISVEMHGPQERQIEGTPEAHQSLSSTD